jgi:Tfp pilus assembly protein PilX
MTTSSQTQSLYCHHGRQPVRRGAAAVLAMMFLVLMTTLTLAMYALSSGNVQSASNLSDVSRAQSAAETGLRWTAYRFSHMARPRTMIGNITPAVADAMWPSIKQAITDDLTTSANKMIDPAERTVTATASSLTTSLISTETGGAKFQVKVTQKPSDTTRLLVTSIGTYRQASRAVTMEFKIDKKIRFAIVGKVPIQLGRNTIVEGPIAMGTPNKFPPILMLSDFMHFDTTLANRLTMWNSWLQQNHSGFDNRVSANNAAEYSAAVAAGFKDVNGDAYIDEWDFFLERFDANHDKAVDMAEFANPSTGKLYDEQLFRAIDSINAPMFAGDPQRTGYQDNKLDDTDGYAKVRGNIMLAPTSDGWSANLAPQNKTINDMMQGTVITTSPTDVPVEFGVDPANMIDLNPQNFEQCSTNYRAKTGAAAGATSKTASVIQNATLAATDANGGTVLEESPKGSTSFQAVYKRPVFRNMTLKNVIIPKGLNPLFDNCKFQGVTFVDTQHDITTTTGAITYNKDDGMTWARKATSSSSAVSTAGTFTTDSSGKYIKYQISGMSSPANITSWDSSGQPILPSSAGSFSYGSSKSSTGSTLGNNVRFNNCQFEGPIAGNYATAYTHFANSWEFTGATLFNNKIDDTATIVSPQVNIEMGSFTNPSQAPSTMIGVVVAGNLDIRGSTSVDGSIIVTGDGAGNTTLSYFGANDGDTNAGANPEGGYGRLNLRYNPYRALPDGINLAIDMLPVTGSYSEGVSTWAN